MGNKESDKLLRPQRKHSENVWCSRKVVSTGFHLKAFVSLQKHEINISLPETWTGELLSCCWNFFRMRHKLINKLKEIVWEWLVSEKSGANRVTFCDTKKETTRQKCSRDEISSSVGRTFANQ